MRDDTLSQLAALKQDAKDFGWRQMAREREKRATLEPLHEIAKALLPKLGISQQNLLYYASLANFYTVHDLRNLKAEQTQLYLLCYAWVRYRQLTDNLVDAMAYHMKQLEDEISTGAKQAFVAEQVRRHQDTPQVGRLLSLYVDDSVADPTPFGEVRQRAYKIMSEGRAAKHRATHERQASRANWHCTGKRGRPGQTHPPPSAAVICHARLCQHRPLTARGSRRWPGPRACSPSSSACRSGRSQNVRQPRCRNGCGRIC